MHNFFADDSTVQRVEFEKIEFSVHYKSLLQKNGFSSLSDFIFAPTENSFRDVPGRLTVGIDLRDGVRKQRVYLKRHWTLSKSQSTAPHREALAEFNNINDLTQEGIAVPHFMAVGYGFVNGHAVGFIMMREVPGKPADDFIREDVSSVALKNELIDALAAFAAKFHRLGYNHRDFYLCHIFVSNAAGELTLSLIDLQRVQKRRVFRERWIIKDLAQMAYSSLTIATKTERLRFYLKYAGVASLSAVDKKFIQAIHKKVLKMVRREKKGNML